MTVIRSGMIISMMTAGLLSACATQESSTPAMGGGATATSGRQMPINPLQNCISRIPKDATPGQRSVAEQTCTRDYGTARTDSQQVASGTEGDTLQACMNRIPRDASAGQRMMAESSCKRDETNR
jgi:hypothetical protein